MSQAPIKFFVFLFLWSGTLRADIDLIGQVGKRWSESKDRILASKQSFGFAAHGKLPLNKTFSLLMGPSLLLDQFEANDHCEKIGCYSSFAHKVGWDLGGEFSFPLIRVFLYGRTLLHSRTRHKVSGKTNMRFPKRLAAFEGGNNEGEQIKRSLGFNIISGLKWDLIEDLALTLSFEMAYEKQRTESSSIDVINERGDTLHLSSSLNTDWHTSNSSAMYMGLSYTL